MTPPGRKSTVTVYATAEARVPLWRWLGEAGYEVGDPPRKSDVHVVDAFLPDAAVVLARRPGPTVLTTASPPPSQGGHVPFGFPGAPDPTRFVRLAADAYAGTRDELREAVAWLLAVPREAGRAGRFRLTYLGRLFDAALRGGSLPPIGSSLVLASRPLTIGRGQDVQLQLASTALARHHIELRWKDTDSALELEDLGGTNGTWLRGERIEEARMQVGDELALAAQFRLRLDGADPIDDAPTMRMSAADPIGFATMKSDGTLVLQLRAEGPGGEAGEARFTYRPNHPKYAQLVRHIGNLKPGESRLVLPFPDEDPQRRMVRWK